MKNNANIRKETIKITKRADGAYGLELMFDSNFECMITVYIATTECRSAVSIPL